MLILNDKLEAAKAQLVTKYQKDSRIIVGCKAATLENQTDGQMPKATTTPHRPYGREIKSRWAMATLLSSHSATTDGKNIYIYTYAYYITNLLSFIWASMCHNAFGVGTPYVCLETVRLHLFAVPSGSTSLRVERVLIR